MNINPRDSQVGELRGGLALLLISMRCTAVTSLAERSASSCSAGLPYWQSRICMLGFLTAVADHPARRVLAPCGLPSCQQARKCVSPLLIVEAHLRLAQLPTSPECVSPLPEVKARLRVARLPNKPKPLVPTTFSRSPIEEAETG